VLRWLNDVSAYERLCRDLAELRERVAVPGACTRAAQYVLDTLNERQKDRGRAAG
jgi:hypothetical protein